MIRRYGAAFLAAHGPHLCSRQRQALRALRDCRTAAMGGRVLRCNHCSAETCLYNSCCDRHCQFNRFLTSLYSMEWVVYSKPPFGGPEQVLKYLARYTHRVAISNERIESVDDGQVTFRYKDYAGGSRWRRMTLEAHEFLRRFLLHVLPKGLMRIRTFGFLANRCAAEKLALCRQLLAVPPAQAVAVDEPEDPQPFLFEPQLCRECGQGFLEIVDEFCRRVSIFDSS